MILGEESINSILLDSYELVFQDERAAITKVNKHGQYQRSAQSIAKISLAITMPFRHLWIPSESYIDIFENPYPRHTFRRIDFYCSLFSSPGKVPGTFELRNRENKADVNNILMHMFL